jgi:hypothetical protein
MALHTLGTNTTTSLQCSSSWLASPPPGGAFTAADLAALNQSITSDDDFGTIASGYSFGVQAVLTTGTTNSNTSLTSVSASGGSPPITQIQVTDVVLGIGIPLGTFVTAVAAGGATITISQAATTSSAGTRLAFVRLSSDIADSGQGGGLSAQGQLFVPNRGILKVLPGDRIAVDNTGFPILVSGNSIGYAGSQWTFV